MGSLETPRSLLIKSTICQVMDPLVIEVAVNPAMKSPEVDPEVSLKVDHLVGLAVLLPQVTESILVTELILMTEVRIETVDQILVPTIVRIMTSTILAMTDTVITDIMTLIMADIMTGVMEGGMTIEVNTGLYIGVPLVDLQTVPGLMSIIQTTCRTDNQGVTLVSETGKTVVVLLTTEVTGTAVMTVIAGAHLMTAMTIAEAAPPSWQA